MTMEVYQTSAEEVNGAPMYLQIVRMNEAWIVWFGRSSAKLSNMALSLPPASPNTAPIATSLLKPQSDRASRIQLIAARLSKRFNKLVVLSADCDELFSDSPETSIAAERFLIDSIKTYASNIS
eukprot:ANDGO_08135.mRNA.1 hypothetical protein